MPVSQGVSTSSLSSSAEASNPFRNLATSGDTDTRSELSASIYGPSGPSQNTASMAVIV